MGNSGHEKLVPSRKFHFGLEHEERAVRLLQDQDAVVIARNFRARGGELDIVIEESRGDGPPELVFVEVRVRRKGSWMGQLEAIDPFKLECLRRACGAFLARYRGKARTARLDLMVWDGDAWSRFRNLDPGF